MGVWDVLDTQYIYISDEKDEDFLSEAKVMKHFIFLQKSVVGNNPFNNNIY